MDVHRKNLVLQGFGKDKAVGRNLGGYRDQKTEKREWAFLDLLALVSLEAGAFLIGGKFCFLDSCHMLNREGFLEEVRIWRYLFGQSFV